MKINKSIEEHYSFLKRSVAVNKGKGSSAYYSKIRHPLRFWSKAYPETTGYLIPSLMRIQEQEDIDTSVEVEQCMRWLAEDVQFKDGGFPSLYAGNTRPSLFNSAQIALGFHAYGSRNSSYKVQELKLVNWLSKQLEEGKKEIHYRGDFIPSYYTRVVWPCLLMSQKHEHVVLQHLAEKLLKTLLLRIDKDFFPLKSGFQGDKAFTHTLAYTVRGLMESAILLDDSDLLQLCRNQIDAQISSLKKHQLRFAGSYMPSWEGDFSFRCLTGEWQWVIIFLKASQLFKEQKYFSLAEELIHRLDSTHFLYPKGAVLGSKPLWGAYMPWKAPNWAAKFALDALLLYKKLDNDKG